MTAAKDWHFQQLGGARKLLTLAGPTAPHGRPRRKPVVSDGIRLREEAVFYPDANPAAVPTRHVFGVAHDDWELKGRFMSKQLGGPGAARALADEWKIFVAEAQPVFITWGDILSGTGLVTAFIPERESEEEIAYTITIKIDTTGFQSPRPVIVGGGPTQLCQALQNELADGLANPPSLPHVGDMKPSFLDGIDDLVSSINGFTAQLLNIAQSFDDFASGTVDQLERLRAGLQQARTAVERLRTTIFLTTNEEALIARDARTDLPWFKTRCDYDVSTTAALALLDELDRQTEIALRGQVLTVYVPRGGDSWESISTKYYGGPDGAGRIRDANGAQYGEPPTPGRQILVPVAA